jgi:hypothetical protein
VTPVDEAQRAHSTTPAAPLVDAPEVAPPDYGIFEYAAAGIGDTAGTQIPPPDETEPTEPTFGQSSTDFDESLAATQLIDPLGVDESKAPTTSLFEAESPDVDPPSAVAESATPWGSDSMHPSAADKSYPDILGEEKEATGAGSSPWIYLLVAVIAVGAAALVATRFDTPLSGLFGSEASPELAADTGEELGAEFTVVAGPPSVPADLEGAGDESPPAGIAGVATDALEPTPESQVPSETVANRALTAGGAPPPSPRTTQPVAVVAPSVDIAPTPIAETQRASVDLEPLRLERITWWTVEGDTVVRLWLDGRADQARLESLRVVNGEPRFVLKLTGIAGPVPRDPVPIGSAHVDQLRFGVHPGPDGRQLHAVADLTDSDVELVGAIVADEGGLELRFSRP